MIRWGFWRRPKLGQLTVDVLKTRLEREEIAAIAERDRATARECASEAQLPPMHYGHGQMPKSVRGKQMESSARFDWPEVTP